MEEIRDKIREYMEKYEPQLKKIAVVVLLIIVCLAVFAFREKGEENAMADEAEAELAIEETETAGSGTIFVDIGGEVKNPMLAELPEGSRVEDAIEAAGGLTDNADMTSINRAAFAEDGAKIYIPAVTEPGEISASGGAAAAASAGVSTSTGKININTADSETLQELNGVGPSTAQKIIDYRTSRGSFGSIEDIKNVSGIGDKTYEKLKDFITI